MEDIMKTSDFTIAITYLSIIVLLVFSGNAII